ncbi:MAG: trigger factor [Candidatus Saccharimonadales bacterium]
MQITKKQLNPTKVELTIAADVEQLKSAKNLVLKELAKDLKLAGFRKGHAPVTMVEKVVDQQLLQNKIIDHVVNQLYSSAVEQEKLKVVGSPEVNLAKYVPDTTLELTAIAEVIGDIKLPDYKKFSFKKHVETVDDDEVEKVIDDLLARDAAKNEVQRAAKDGDEVTIDFAGSDAKTKAAIEGGSGNDYPLIIGSNTFIPGFEPELIGLKSGDEKTFVITFPKDYPVAALQSKKVRFEVAVKKVSELVKPKLDETFVAKIGPFKTPAELRSDIRKQVGYEKDVQAQRVLENELLTKLGEKTVVALPEALVEQEVERMLEEEKRNLMYRGQTWQEHLKAEGKTEEEHRAEQREQAIMRVRIGLALGEVAEKEGVQVTQQEFEARLDALKQQYTDKQMQAELAKPENQRDILSRILTEKTIAVLLGYTLR